MFKLSNFKFGGEYPEGLESFSQSMLPFASSKFSFTFLTVKWEAEEDLSKK